MAFKIADAFVEVTARTDNMGTQVKGAVRKLEVDTGPDAEKAGSGIGKKFMSGFLSNIRSPSSLKTFLATFAGISAAALASIPAITSAAKWIGELSNAAGAASPALLALAAGGTFLVLTMKQIGPAIGEAMLPITEGFTKAGTAAGILAANGIRPLSAEFTKLGMPIIAEGMNRIAVATNGVVTRFLEWAKSTPGLNALRNVTDATADSMDRLGPFVSRLVEAFGNMLSRIAHVSMAAGTEGLAGVLERLTGWFNNVNAATVQNGLDGLATKYLQVRDAIVTVIDWVKQAIDFWRTYRTEIGFVQDGLAILAIAFGGPVIAVAAAVLLIIRHWDELKIAWRGVVDYFNTTPGTQAMDDLKAAGRGTAESLVESWGIVKAAVGPVLQEIWDKILNKVIPAFAEFLAAVEPVVSWFREKLAPVVSTEMHGVLAVISGVLDIIVGAFQIATGILTLDWSKTWEGIKNIGSGLWQIIVQLFKAFGGQLVIDLFNAGQRLWQDFTGWVGRLKDNSISFLSDLAARAGGIVGGLIGNAVGKAEQLWRDFTGWIGRMRDNTVGFIENMRDRVVGALNTLKDGFWWTVDRIGDAWNRLRDMVRHPVNGVIDIWNNVNNLWGGQDIRHFATGGRVPGSGASDIVPAMLTPGEFVVKKSIAGPTRRFLEALNAGQTEAFQAAGGQFGRMQYFAAGGAVSRAQEFARAQHGKPYIWSAVGPNGYDCSGFMSAITNVLRGRNPHSRVGTTGSAPWPGFVNGLKSAFGVGFFKGNPGHMAGTLGGANVEAGGSPSRTKFVAGAAGAQHRQFRGHMSLPEVGGIFTGDGGGAGGFFAGLAEATIRAALAPMNGIVDRLPHGPSLLDRVPRDALSKIRDFVTQKALSFVGYGATGGGAPVSGSVVDQVRAVADGFGWGGGAEWEALSALIQKESSWNPGAANPRSSARGLFQKMTSIHGPVEATAGGQAQWGLNYIRGRYGSPSAAWAFHRRNNYYDNGGVLPPGLSMAYNGTGGPEAVLTKKQWQELVSDRRQSITVNIQQTAGSPAETGRFVALALRTVS